MLSRGTVRVFPSVLELSKEAAREIKSLYDEAIASRGRFTLALSGGETPRTLYEILGGEYRDAIDWSRVHLYWGDERYVPADDTASNYRMARESLIDRIPIPPENVHPIPTSFANPEDAAKSYRDELARVIPLDLILLGLGDDGHTASLFPGPEFNCDDERLVIVTHSPKPPVIRISMTIRAINQARNVFFLVAGTEKSVVLRKVLETKDDPRYPASLIQPEALVWFVDRAASP